MFETTTSYFFDIIHEISIFLGGRSIVQRGCANPSIDHDESTQTIPSGSQCTVTTNTISRSQETKCFYSCESDFCNNVTMGEKR